jgi:hypothetical protein
LTNPRAGADLVWAGLTAVWGAPRSRCLRHSEIGDVYRPSRRNSAPLPAFVQTFVLLEDLRLVAEYRRGPRARSGTSGSGSVLSSMAPAWARPSNESGMVVSIRGTPPRTLSSTNRLLDPPHLGLTRRDPRVASDEPTCRGMGGTGGLEAVKWPRCRQRTSRARHHRAVRAARSPGARRPRCWPTWTSAASLLRCRPHRPAPRRPDVDWSLGDGAETVEAPAVDLLLALTGRRALWGEPFSPAQSFPR